MLCTLTIAVFWLVILALSFSRTNSIIYATFAILFIDVVWGMLSLLIVHFPGEGTGWTHNKDSGNWVFWYIDLPWFGPQILLVVGFFLYMIYAASKKPSTT